MLDIENDPNLSEIYNDGYALLEVTFVDINNTGVYKCEIDSIFGTDSSELQGMNTYIVAIFYISTLFSVVFHMLHVLPL